MRAPSSKRQLHPRWQLQPAGDFGHLLGDMRLDAALGVVEGGDDEVFQDLDLPIDYTIQYDQISAGLLKNYQLLLILRDGMTLVMLGIVPGLVGSLALTRSLKSMLFGVRAVDPTTYLAIVIVLCATALLACYTPARRASKVDPMTVLKHE